MANKVSEKLDEIEYRIMSGLKDFQRATVERIDALFSRGVKRILVSDEVGLGKTLIARGTIAKFAKLRKEKYNDKLVKVVYVCSNAAIAEQNLGKLKITQELSTENTSSSRLSMQHLTIFSQENNEKVLNNYIQLIPITPDTSFRITSGTGSVSERGLMFAILKRLPELAGHIDALETLMTDDAKKAWRSWCKNYYEERVEACNSDADGEYLEYMVKGLARELSESQPNGVTYLEELIDTCNTIEREEPIKKGIIGKLRIIFAKLSLGRLDPDLVIMDEFQRFKFLLSSDADLETNLLAKKFFENQDTWILLLSATPYKMYSTMEEIDETLVDEHYSEFFEVMKFLMPETEQPEFEEIWKNYSICLKEFANGSSAIVAAKKAAENAMYNHVCRTERIEAVGSADIIDDSDVKAALQISENDIKSYIQLQKLLDDISGERVPADYVKSCPYLLSFMREYKLKQTIESYFRHHPDKIGKLMRETFFIKKKTLDDFSSVPCNNARLENLIKHTFDEGVKSELLLWVPASKPYYAPNEGPFINSEGFSKTLVFSSWEMVPRMIASMLSYESERRTIGKLAKREQRETHYFRDENDRFPRPKLTFALKDDEPAAMTLFCLIYPFTFLADCYDPIDCMNRGLTLPEITGEIKAKISEKLASLPAVAEGKEDPRWYYLAPLMFDKDEGEDPFYGEENAKEEGNKGFIAHVLKIVRYRSQIINGEEINLGKRPDDLADVLADMAVASPAVCAYRIYRKYTQTSAKRFAGELARVFINRMNTPEWTGVVDLCFGSKNDDAHWQNVLAYCKAGNIQATFDEYFHLLSNGMNLKEDHALDIVHNQWKESASIRTTVYNIDTYIGFKARINGKKEKNTGVRSHFAVAFTKGDGRNEYIDRKKSMRNAFNSPFRPFVLASTSIGQEGLDFHNYCRKIVHWNLPSNPIDLEQREGRINRFECLAIRQNVAKRYGNMAFENDIWQEMFTKAKECERTDETSDLVPFWGLQEKCDMIKIERIVPMYPLSRDKLSYERMIKILSLYRLTLGQARQEELIEYILTNSDEKRQGEIKRYFINLSPYYKEKK